MDKLLYVAMTGALGSLNRQSVNNHNLANIHTIGFKEDLAAVRSVAVEDNKLNTRVPVVAIGNGFNSKSGEIMNTERDLDIAIDGEGFIAVVNPDGSEEMTRSGNLTIGRDGTLQIYTGQPVSGNNGPIAIPPYESLDISEDGTISIVPLGDTSGNLVVIDRIKLVSPDLETMSKGENGTMKLEPKLTKSTTIKRDAEGNIIGRDTQFSKQSPDLIPDAAVNLVSRALETSNVNPTATLINMIELSRNYEMQIKIIKSAEENDKFLGRLLAI